MNKSVLYIVNPIAGKKGRKQRILSQLKATGADIVYTEYAGHATELARLAGSDVVVAVGGDGTLNEVARGLVGTDKILGLMPCGSGDGLARHLGIRGSFHHMEDIIRHGKVQPLDYARINGRPFFSVSGVGLDAIVSERFAKAGKRGLWTYIEQAVKTWRGFIPEKYTVTIDGNSLEREAVLITVANSNQWGNGAKITPLARTDDGMLDITIIKMFRTIDIPVLAFRLMTGSIHKSRYAECLQGKEISITRSGEGPAHCDGDYMECGKVLDISICPETLRVLVP